VKADGLLLIAGGHQMRKGIKQAVEASGLWTPFEETGGYIKYRQKGQEAPKCCCEP
jgi:hypothetical protein